MRGLRRCPPTGPRLRLEDPQTRALDTTAQGTLDAAVLAVVAEQDGYGYDVLRRLRAAGLSDVGDASVYGTLRRLYSGGALTSYVMPSDEGPHRKYQGITDLGRSQLEDARATWGDFAQTMTGLLETTAEVTA